MTHLSALRPASLVFAATFALIGCTRETIPNTTVEATAQNQEVVDFLESYRLAVEKRDVAALTRMASEDYFDDMGTPGGDDDVDYDALRVGLAAMREGVLTARYQIRYMGLTYATDDRVMADVRYTGWFQVQTPDGPTWERRLEDHRLVLRRQDDGYRILSGM